MGNCEHDTKDNAQTPDNNICNAEEWILSTHYGTSRDNNRFGPTILGSWEVCQGLVHFYIQFEIGMFADISTYLIEHLLCMFQSSSWLYRSSDSAWKRWEDPQSSSRPGNAHPQED